MDGFYLFSNHDTSNILNLSNPNVNSTLASQKKCDNMFSDPKSDHIFSHFLSTYLVYILFLLLCGNYPLTQNRVRCRNLLSIDSLLNRVKPSKHIISRQMQNGDTLPNSKYCLKENFNIVYINTHTLFRFFYCNCILSIQSQSCSQTLDPISQTYSTQIMC